MVETNLNTDYLLPFFEKALLSNDIYKKMSMDDNSFIVSNTQNLVTLIREIKQPTDDLGYLSLITIVSANDFMAYSNLCPATVGPMYLKDIRETRNSQVIPLTVPFNKYTTIKENGLFAVENILDKNNNHKIILDLDIENIEKLQFIKNSASSITITTNGEARINNFKLESNKTYIMYFQYLDRESNNGQEYFMHKSIIEKIPNKEQEMLNEMENFIKKIK
ncbi:MAG: hypothetical protein LBM99_00750 [Bacillales bacterium]|jgi:hypothetical protein|nr:hypothetical protein [Bacillales bacterium]